MRVSRIVLLSLVWACALAVAKPLEVYFVDVEGGQATLFVSPSGESLLVDTGWSGFNSRDADRIAAAAKKAGVKKIDYLLITHYHEDHVGGVPQLAAKLPIRNFVDHGPNGEHGERPDALFNTYVSYRDKGNHIQVKPGDKIPIKGLDVTVVSSAGDVLAGPLPGAGQPNPACAGFQKRAEDKSENARSTGILVSYGSFRIIDLGDLTWNKEYLLACPDNKIGTVSVYLSTHHGMNISGPPAIVDALHPQVAIMNNGAKKGGTAEAWQTIRHSPGLQDIWQLHFAVAGGRDNNAPDTFIANTDEHCTGNWIRLSAEKDGAFTVTNSRNKYSKTYRPGA
ncbi:MAG TPA: MBL fold metallo-hydrolase [Bryobacteraceae bacterium]|nr:MBL fold metallo-hydrolase [Bryobacteraceae bacterium]